MFGFAGIVFGPVVMIIVVTTVNMYRSVYKGVAWVDDFEGNDSDEPEKRPWWRLVLSLGRARRRRPTPRSRPTSPGDRIRRRRGKSEPCHVVR